MKFFISLYIIASVLLNIPGINNNSRLIKSLSRFAVSSEMQNRREIVLDTEIFDQLTGSIYSITGCGPTSAAMLMHSEKGLDITKDQAVVQAYSGGYYYFAGLNFTSGRGVTQENIQGFISSCGYSSQIDHLWNNSDEEILMKLNYHLNENKRVIVGHNSPHGFLHYALVYGKYYENGSCCYKVADPWGGLDSVWSENEMLKYITTVGGEDSTTFEGLVKGIQWLS